MSNPNPAAPPATPPRWFLLLGLLALAGYGALLAVNTTVSAAGSDSSGYLNAAQLLASGRVATEVRIPPALQASPEFFRTYFQPLGFIGTQESPRLVPSYPPGLPLHLALAGKIAGWTLGPCLVGIGGALAALMLCYRVGRELGLDWTLSAAAAVILAACPVMLFTSVQPLSDTLATAWCLAAVLAALRARTRPGWAAGCGMAFAVAVLVRPTNFLLLPALVALLGFQPRRLLLAALPAAPIGAWAAWYNQNLFGGIFRTGYPAPADAFSSAYVAPTAWHFLHWLMIFVPAILLLTPFIAIVRPAGRGRTLIALALWFGAITALYVAYSVSHEAWTCLRFILPAIPALILGGLLGLDSLAQTFQPDSGRRFRQVAAVALAAWSLIVASRWVPRHAVFWVKIYEEAYPAACALAVKEFPADALVLASQLSGALYYYTSFPVLRWDAIDQKTFADYRARAQRAGLPICALLFEGEEPEAFHQRCPGNWTRLDGTARISLWRLESGPAPAPK